MTIGDIVKAVGYKVHRGVIIGFSAKDCSAQVSWYTEDCSLSVHWPVASLTLVKQGPRSRPNGLEPTMQEARIELLEKAVLIARYELIAANVEEGNPLHASMDKAFTALQTTITR